MAYLKVEGHQHIVRDTSSNGIINTDKNAYQIHVNRIREARKSSNDLRNAVRDINNLKQEMSEIKGLLLKLVK
ncbi:virion structural protein [Pelagibacter phage HTVC008M]|jgi:hypothetical protein|uniref:virion structural protein n=1 Tax=Pelagibacter phage HTVC008M TaxID=1283076 RepID=UPI0002B2A389|nr:virion structural protein [Pelagibacter phage HTVC008M]AGE60392.1 hypothetical protein [Pelagibacter phage HTVC008M]